MLPPHVIEQIRRREQARRKEEQKQPQLELPLPPPQPKRGNAEEHSDRGVEIISLFD